MPGQCDTFMERNTYTSNNFISKDAAYVEKFDNGAALLYYQQEWSVDGTWCSFVIPGKTVIDRYRKVYSGDTYKIEINIFKGNVYQSLHMFNEESLGNSLSYLGLFYAGMRDGNVDLVNFAINVYYTEQNIEFYSEHGLGMT